MSNPFATLIEKTAPTPQKIVPTSDENANGNESHDSRSDTDPISTPPSKGKVLEFETPNTGKKKVARTASFRHDLVSPAPKSTGRVRSTSNREMSSSATPSKATPMKPGGLGTHVFEKTASSASKSVQKLPKPFSAVGTPVRNRANSTREREVVKSTSKGPLAGGKKPKPAPKMLDKALRESLGGFEGVTQEMQVAAKKQREKANSLRRRYSQSKDATEIENSARRQSAIMLNEFKELVKTVADDTGEVQATETEQGQSSNPRRESAALDQALVRQMLPRKVCIPLREGKKVPPEAFQGVSIFFSDVVGFTTISSEVEPIIVHELLNNLFTVMDYCTALFPLYKVETIGDAYMVAGGLPEPNAHNARDLADFALVVSAVVAACVRSPVDGSPIQIRMGCHTGDVMAGVVGTLMPRYCLFGDSVNTSSRMESNGAPGKIHCSEAFAMKVREGGLHTVVERGEIAVKGKGAMRTFWLDGAAEGNFVSSHAAIAEVIARCEELLADE